MARKFTDSLGRDWEIALDPWLLTHVLEATREKCRKCDGSGKSGTATCEVCDGAGEVGILLTAWADHEWRMAEELAVKPHKLCDVLWAICEEQAIRNGFVETAKANGVPLEREFARGLGGQALVPAYTALAGAVADFSMSPEERDAMELAMQKAQEVARLTSQGLLQAVRERVAKIDTSQMAKNYIDSALSSQPSPDKTPSVEESPSDF